MTVEAIAAVLGGVEAIQSAPKTTADLVTLTREGLPVKALSALTSDLNMDRKAVGRVLGIPERTWMRRMASGARLTVGESDRTLRFARVLATAIDVLGTTGKASVWLQTENRALLGQRPFELLDTDAGVQTVEALLGRIAYGVYS